MDSTIDSILASDPAAPGLILRKRFYENLARNNWIFQRFIDGPAKNSGQRLNNVNLKPI